MWIQTKEPRDWGFELLPLFASLRLCVFAFSSTTMEDWVSYQTRNGPIFWGLLIFNAEAQRREGAEAERPAVEKSDAPVDNSFGSKDTSQYQSNVIITGHSS